MCDEKLPEVNNSYCQIILAASFFVELVKNLRHKMIVQCGVRPLALFIPFQEEVQNKFQKRFQSLEHEVKRRDEIIHQLQTRIQELEVNESPGFLEIAHAKFILFCLQGNPITNGCLDEQRPRRRLVRGGSSEEGDISDQDETFSDQPFMVPFEHFK
jgi:hypothetical protein